MPLLAATLFATYAAARPAAPAVGAPAAEPQAAETDAETDAEAGEIGPETALKALSDDSCEDLIKLWEETKDSDVTPIENLALPLESHANGRVKTLLRARYALVPVEGVVRGSGILVERYDSAGRLDCIIAADSCIFDRETERGYCEGNVRIERKGVRVTGVNMVWRVKEQGAKILSDAKVVANRFVKDMGTLLK